jgi:hypothetical protein
MARIALINLPSNIPDYPSLGLASLSASLKKSGHQVIIAGEGSDKFFSSTEKIKVIGKVTEIAEHLDKNDVFLLPVEYGAGARMRVLDILSTGLPFVSTPKGIEGYPPDIKEGGIIVDQIKDFPQAVVKLLDKKTHFDKQQKIFDIRADYTGESVFPAFIDRIKRVLKR